MTADFTRSLANFVIETPAGEIPEEVFERAGTALVDTVGCALAGCTEEASAIALETARDLGAAPRAGIWGHGLKTAPSAAAFVNGISAHVLDLDDSLPGLRGHPSAPILAAALAVAEAEGATGRDLLAAFALAVEVTGKVGKVIGHGHYFHGWHTTATVGIFGTTAAVSRLLGADAGELCNAWGIVASMMGGLRRNFGTMTKSFGVGHAASAGVDAALLAHKGFTASESIFDGDDGVFAVYAGDDGIQPGETLDLLGNPWSLLNPGISVKRWPCCYGAHRPLGGVFELIETHDIKPEEVEAVGIGFLPMSDKALIHKDPQTGMEGKFSIEYCVAGALVDREITLGSFTDEKVRRPVIRDLMSKVERRHIDAEGSFNAHYGYTDIEIRTRDGVHTISVDRTPGSLAWPLSVSEIREKFIGCAGNVMDSARAAVLYDRLRTIAECGDVAEAMREVTG